ncbi:MAG: sugar phosphate isomerase/epimerase [bacterium]|nr:sugar phosphate isomerase/epimerase [bacterium]
MLKVACCWLYAISKYGYPPSVPDTFAALEDMARLGFTNVELEGVRKENLLTIHSERAKLKSHSERLGLRIINFCPVLPSTVSLDGGERKEGLELFEVGVECATYFGCETVQLDSFTPPLRFKGESPYKEAIKFARPFQVEIDPAFSWQEQWSVLVDTVKRCARMAAHAGLMLTMEPRVGEMVSNTDAMLRLMDHVDDENFYAVLDTGHQNAQKEILPLSVEKLGSRIKYVHVSDNDSRTNEHLPLGKGTIDWDGVFLGLAKHNFDGFIAIDIGGVENLDEAYRESVQFLERLAQRLGL